MVYDSDSQTAMGGYDQNYDVTTHVWDSLVANSTVHVLYQAQQEQQPIPHLNYDRISEG